MDTLTLLPDTDGYSYQPATVTQRQQHRGAAGRYGILPGNATGRVTCTWSLGSEDTVTLCNFIRRHNEEQRPFLIDLIVMGKGFKQCIAWFDSDTLSLRTASGQLTVLSCTLQAYEA